MTALFGPERHEPLAGDAWSEPAARAAIKQWADAAHQAFDPDTGWAPHPRDDADPPDDPMHFLYCGSGGAIWALEHLAAVGAIDRQHDFRPFVAGIVDRNRANWWPRVPPYSPSNKPPFLQDCHGAPGMLSRLATWPADAPQSETWDELLRQAGELTWHAGPVNKGVAFCHGSAGSAHAFLKLFVRTGDERWLDRARAFAMHGIKQVERDRALHGQGRHTLWSGDLGMACVLWDCISGRPGFPTLDVF